MNRMEFMKELEQLLSDVATEECQEALLFYENYFEDAGKDQEVRILEELGSPERIAGIIKADLNCNESKVNRGEYTEGGYRDTAYQENKFEMVGGRHAEELPTDAPVEYQDVEYREISDSQKGAKVTLEKPKMQESFDPQGERAQDNPEMQGGYGNYQSGQGQYQQGMGQQNNYQQQYTDPSMYRTPKKRSAGMVILMVLAVIFIVIPIGIPLACAGFAIFIGLFSGVFGLLIGFGAAAFAMLLSGILLIVVGIVKMFAIPWFGVVCLGAGCIVFGLGILFAILTILICSKVMPALVRGFVAICKLPFQKRSVSA